MNITIQPTPSTARSLEFALQGLPHVSLRELELAVAASAAVPRLSSRERRWAEVYAARSLLYKEPNYAFVAARLLLDIVYHEALGKEITEAPLDFAEDRKSVV